MTFPSNCAMLQVFWQESDIEVSHPPLSVFAFIPFCRRSSLGRFPFASASICLSNFEQNAINVNNPANGTMSTYVRDPRIGWTGSMWVANGQHIYFVENQSRKKRLAHLRVSVFLWCQHFSHVAISLCQHSCELFWCSGARFCSVSALFWYQHCSGISTAQVSALLWYHHCSVVSAALVSALL